MLPALAHAEERAGRDQSNEHRWGEKEHRWGDHDTDRGRDRQVPVVVPFFSAVLVFSSRRLLAAALAKK
jgi:hypothetical protein